MVHPVYHIFVIFYLMFFMFLLYVLFFLEKVFIRLYLSSFHLFLCFLFDTLFYTIFPLIPLAVVLFSFHRKRKNKWKFGFVANSGYKVVLVIRLKIKCIESCLLITCFRLHMCVGETVNKNFTSVLW